MDTLKDKKFSESFDRSIQSAIGKLTGGISPAALFLAFADWYGHLLTHPAKQVELIELYQQGVTDLLNLFNGHLIGNPNGEYCVLVPPEDKRFKSASWQQFPYSFVYESFLLMQNWWHVAATHVRGVSAHHQEVVDFTVRQVLDMWSPSNFIFSNPEILEATSKEGGMNFVKGMQNFVDDFHRYVFNEPPAGAAEFAIGKNIALSPGKVIYRNELIELIQYSPGTESVYARPILITPAWIMKYYILDLAPKHSLVRYLVKKGHTVFMISWKNPTKKDRDLTMDDYLNLGVMASLDVINAVVPKEKIHLVGYCLGGTLTAIATAAMARDNDERLATMTLFAAQTDFKDPGQLGLFIDESQISFLESIMFEKGYLDTKQMAGAFQLLRSNDLIWSRMQHEYLVGERKPLIDLMAWNADATRLPYRMHANYLRHLFLNNELAEAKYKVNGKPVSLSDIRIPIFVVATERDHVSPWQSVYKVIFLTSGKVTFVLTSGGHNVGIVSLPSKHTSRFYRIATFGEEARYVSPDNWYQHTAPHQGSWWTAFAKWLSTCSGEQTSPPTMGTKAYPAVCDAPGTYVLQK